MALSVDDLPAGVSIASEGYLDEDATIASFHRVFEVRGSSLGGSELVSLESDAKVFDTVFSSQAVLDSVGRSFVTGAAAVIRDALGRQGLEPEALRVEPLAGFEAGDASVAFASTLETSVGTLEGTFVFVQVGRAIGSVAAVSTGANASPEDIRPLITALVSRLEAGFGA
jgi:hypothetical protein